MEQILSKRNAWYLQHSRGDFAAPHQLSHMFWHVVGDADGFQFALSMQLLQRGPAPSPVTWVKRSPWVLLGWEVTTSVFETAG